MFRAITAATYTIGNSLLATLKKEGTGNVDDIRQMQHEVLENTAEIIQQQPEEKRANYVKDITHYLSERRELNMNQASKRRLTASLSREVESGWEEKISKQVMAETPQMANF